LEGAPMIAATLNQICQTLLFLALLGVSAAVVAGGLIYAHRKEQEELNQRFDKKGK
jgi:Na+-transporting NADH:ubiquinone oxidoreductase subunit NqrC